MVEAMRSFSTQRWLGLSLLVLCSAIIFWAYAHFTPTFPRLGYVSGWALFLLMLVLTLYNGRKKLPFLPLGTSEGWLQFHIYAGFLTVALFLAHIRFRPPTGWFDIILASLYVLVTGSGVAG